MTPLLLKIQGLSKRFGGLTALRELDLELPSGQILDIIGPNGSGKTTFFNLVSGLYTPSAGAILLTPPTGAPVDLVGKKPFQIVILGVARTFQNLRLFSQMSVVENVMVGMHGRSDEGILGAVLRTRRFRDQETRIRAGAEELLGFFGDDLLPFKDVAAANLSYANQRRLEIVRAMATRPHILLLDEPAAGMNPTEKARLMEDIRRLKQMGFTILLIEHDMILVRHISDRVVAFDHGEKIAEGSFEEVKANPQVIEAYLGKGAASVQLTT